MSLLSTNSEGKTLYAICAEKHNRRTGAIVPQILHVHADSEGEARWIFSQDSAHRRYKIIAVAPAVGFHVADEHGEQLIA